MPKRKTDDELYQIGLEYFWDHVVRPDDPDECWQWTGPHNRDGYGQLNFMRRPIGAHRLSCILHNGPIPDGLVVLHSCLSKECCNPRHIRAGTKKENSQELAVEKRKPEWQLARWGYVKRR